MHASVSAPVLRVLASCAALSALALLSGCDSPSQRRAALRENREPPQQPLQGSDAFFGENLVVLARLSSPMEYLQRPKRGDGEDTSESEGGERRSRGGPGGGGGGGGAMSMSGGMGGGGMGMGGGGGRGGMGGMGGGHGGMPPGERGGGMGGGPRGGMPGGMGGMPRQFLKITFENKSAETLALHVADVKSLLGNLAPVPDRLTIAAGQSASLEAMRGNLAANFDAFEVTLRLRSGTREETKTLRLVPTGEAMPLPPTEAGPSAPPVQKE